MGGGGEEEEEKGLDSLHREICCWIPRMGVWIDAIKSCDLIVSISNCELNTVRGQSARKVFAECYWWLGRFLQGTSYISTRGKVKKEAARSCMQNI